jgi:carboxysome shell carbonic anhydrase
MRIPFSAVRRRSHAGALFDIENTVNRWVKTEHKRYRENKPNEAHKDTRYLKIVTYHFSSVDPLHQGCAAHGSDDKLAAREGREKLLAFREAVENSFCCGASVDLMLIGLDTDTDSLKIHLSSSDGKIDLENTISSLDIYNSTLNFSKDEAEKEICQIISGSVSKDQLKGLDKFVFKLIVNNISQIDYVKKFHKGSYEDIGHAERFIGVGIGFKEVHLRNLTYFAHLDTVEEGAPDLDVGVKIFTGLNVSQDLPIPVVIRFDYSGKVPGAKERAAKDCYRVNNAISIRYKSLVDKGLLHTCLTIRDRDNIHSAQIIGMSLDQKTKEAH